MSIIIWESRCRTGVVIRVFLRHSNQRTIYKLDDPTSSFVVVEYLLPYQSCLLQQLESFYSGDYMKVSKSRSTILSDDNYMALVVSSTALSTHHPNLWYQ